MTCPLECVNIACEKPDWLSTHESFVLTIFGILGAGFGVLFTYFLKSRCKSINCGCISCERDVLQLQPTSVEITS